MKTPICDFVRDYAAASPVRLHMPGHKGKALLGPEALDITEIPGADVLYRAKGVIRQSEENAAALFGSARTLYSAEGSSLCIRAMLQLAQLYARLQGRRPRIAAGRNAHRVFLEAAALLDLEIRWLGDAQELLSCQIRPEALEALFADEKTAPTAVYVTSPDYLGNCAALAALAEFCHRNGALLLVDNAHGAYLKFLSPSRHPLDLGADLCCDSAHKTLPVLTGGAYLHLSQSCPQALLPMAEQALSLFASTSPSYLILQSLDAANALLAGDYPVRIADIAAKLEALKAALQSAGWTLSGTEPLKLTFRPKSRGYTGEELGALLGQAGIVCEFADPDCLVLMFSPACGADAFSRLQDALGRIPPRAPLREAAPPLPPPAPVLSPREALLSPFETLPVEAALGRILASPSVGCPPAVPILICGERIGPEALALFRYYGIETVDVIAE
ncbi:MAG: amino acid decarboxylase [Oscillospiraceae bacterium]|nr:amino acid decarboxylase [Oscillospiraceae bacterium]